MLKKIINLLLHLLGLPAPFGDIVEPIFENAAKTMLADATVAALPIVESLKEAKLPSRDKAEKAVADLVAAFKKDGKELASSVAHAAVELALQKVKSLV